MRLPQHLGVSVVISSVTFAASRSFTITAASLLAGVFLDLDHIFDYVREYGPRPDPRFFFHSFNATLYRRVVLPFHCWEWPALLIAISIETRGNPAAVGLLIGMAQHLTADQFTNKVSGWGYFLTYRVKQRFITRNIFPGKGLQV